MLSFLLLLGLLVVSQCIVVVIVRAVAKRLGGTRTGLGAAIGTAIGTALLLLGLSVVASAVSLAVPVAGWGQVVALNLGVFAGGLVGTRIIVGKTLGLAPKGAWIMTGTMQVAGLLMFAAILVLWRPFVTESFVVPSNGMAPTIMGYHYSVRCQACGGTFSVPAIANRDGTMYPVPGSLCTHCKRHFPVDPGLGLEAADHVVANKLRRPRRWDPVTFVAKDGRGIYVQRMVGLPGETVWIEDGAVWINGQRESLPPHLTGIVYVDRIAWSRPIDFGRRDRPVALGPDECFLLGDNGAMSNDSRFSGPVRLDSVTGVVDLCYWPPKRIGFVR